MAQNDSNSIAALTHVGGIFFGFIPSLIVFLVKKDDEFIQANAKEALNFQITLMLAWAACFVLAFVVIGAFLMPLVWLASLIFSILAAIKASEGTAYQYPVSLRLIK